jgi:homogentisate 1,2-dioxygenase
MPFYNSKGTIPPKRHTVFKKNKKLLFEQHISREGFSGIYSNLYHLSMPTELIKVGGFKSLRISKTSCKHKTRHLMSYKIKEFDDAIKSRIPLLFNNDIIINVCHIDKNMDYFYRNGHFDELLYVQYGSGVISTNFGDLKYNKGDYVVIPKGVIYNIKYVKKTKMLVVESSSPINSPEKYRNKFGQLLESSPYCERDINVPNLNKPIDKEGNFLIKVRLEDGIQDYIYNHHPFNVVGWDGYYYPWIFNINNFEPIVGSIHQPPSVHQTFEGNNFVVCSFVSRLFDFHKDAIPAPYPHSNVDSDEFIFYSEGSFMSRSDIKEESITYHPMGIPHGPHPGKYEASIGKKNTEELAVMIDTFRPLYLTQEALELSDKNYHLSWIKKT